MKKHTKNTNSYSIKSTCFELQLAGQYITNPKGEGQNYKKFGESSIVSALLWTLDFAQNSYPKFFKIFK